jgi:hypothetical protein
LNYFCNRGAQIFLLIPPNRGAHLRSGRQAAGLTAEAAG